MKNRENRVERLARWAKAAKKRQLVQEVADQLPGIDRAGDLNQLRQHFGKKFGIGPKDLERPKELWSAVRGNEQHQILVRTSRETYMEVIGFVAWLWSELRCSPNKAELIEQLFSTVGVRPSRKVDVLSLVARAVIDYGKGPHARKIWVRDATAIRHLEDIGVPPNGIVEYWQNNPGGLDLWHREWYRRQPRKLETSAKSAEVSGPSPKPAPEANTPSRTDEPLTPDALKAAPVLFLTVPDPTWQTGYRIILQEQIPSHINPIVLDGLGERLKWLASYYRRNIAEDGTIKSRADFRPEDHGWWPEDPDEETPGDEEPSNEQDEEESDEDEADD
jgi:hypothetical protein